MILKKEEKKELVNQLGEELAQAKALVFSDYQGVKADDVQKLRGRLKQEGVEHKVVKITLLKRALRKAGIDTAELDFQVPLAVSFSAHDEVMPARLIHEFAQEDESLEILGGVLDKTVIDTAQVKALAELPTLDELRGQAVGAIAGPLRGLVRALSGNIRNLVYALKAVEQSKQ